MINLSPFWFPVVKILPLQLTAQMTDYETITHMCKQVQQLIDNDTLEQEAIKQLQSDIEQITDALNNITDGNYAGLLEIISNAIKNVWFGLTQEGKFVAYVPESWDNITFNTTGLDIVLDCHPEYGRLVLSY